MSALQELTTASRPVPMSWGHSRAVAPVGTPWTAMAEHAMVSLFGCVSGVVFSPRQMSTREPEAPLF